VDRQTRHDRIPASHHYRFLGAALGPRIASPFLYTVKTRSELAYDLLGALNADRLKTYAEISACPVYPDAGGVGGDAEANGQRRELLHRREPRSTSCERTSKWRSVSPRAAATTIT
jgi:hypothetical protein